MRQGAKEAKAQAEAAAAASAAEVAGVRQQYDAATADLDRLAKERDLALEAWEEERRCIDADRAALLASMEACPCTVSLVERALSQGQQPLTSI